MTMLMTVKLLGALTVVSASSAALAQGHDERCIAAVKQLCGTNAVGACFDDASKWSQLPDTCTGDVQTMIEMEGEAAAEAEGIGRQDVVDREGNLYGFSYGGRLRMAPDTQSSIIASLQEGERIRILENTGVNFDGYLWYRVLTTHGEGFHWGGIFCSESEQAHAGVLSRCQDGMDGAAPVEAASPPLPMRGSPGSGPA